MKIKTTVTVLALLVGMLSVPLATAYGQDNESDMNVDSMTLVPFVRVAQGGHVNLAAYIQNIENCYIVFGDDRDSTRYSNNFTSGDLIKVEARVRSTGGYVAGRAFIGVATFPFSTSSTSWEIVDSVLIAVPPNSNDAVYIQKIDLSGTEPDLEIDWIKVYEGTVTTRFPDTTWALLFTREAEDYNAGGGTVDMIYPQNVQVEFYDGDPDAGGIKIGNTQVVGDVQRIMQDSTVWIVTENGMVTASETWTSDLPLGWHDIYVTILPSPRESDTSNNEAFHLIEVVPSVPTLSGWGLIIFCGLLLVTGIAVIIRRQAQPVH